MKRLSDSHATRVIAVLSCAAAMFTIAGGYVHLREWLDVYRNVPAAAPGAFVVREGFLVNVGVSFVASVALVGVAVWRTRLTPFVLAGAFVFQAASLITLMASRTSNVLGWSERGWTLGASQSRAVEIGALVMLFAAVVIERLRRNRLALGAAPAA